MINFNLLKTLNIFYFQKNEEIKNNFLKMIEGLFKNVFCSNNSLDLINIVENKKKSFIIDIVISDTSIFNNDIDKVYNMIKKEEFTLPIILITNDLSIDTLLKAIKYKVSDCLCTTVKKNELLASIQKTCKERYVERFKKEIENDFEGLVSIINDIALVSKTDLTGKVTFVNNLFCETTGFSKDELIGKDHLLLSDDKVNLKKRKSWEGKKKYISKTKEVFFLYLNIIPIFNPDNSVKEYMWISFLSTEEELEQNEFKKKVTKSITSSRRINTEAREKIDSLFKELEIRKNKESIKSSLIEEKRRSFNLKNQIFSYKKEIEKKEKILYKSTREELDCKNKDINFILEELDKQIMILEELQEKDNIN